MSPLLTIKTALHSIGANKLRAGLTLLGIVIGVAAVIAAMAVGRGAQEQVSAGIESLGTNLLFVRPVSTQGGNSALTLADSSALLDPVFVPSVEALAPEIQSNGSIVYQRESTFTRILGVTSNYGSVRNFEVSSGIFISPAHVQNRSEVLLLGSNIADLLFGTRDPVGATVRLSGRQFTVIGVLESKGGTALGFEDNQVLVPITTAYYRLSSQRTALGEITVSSINVQVQDVGLMDDAIREISTLLFLRHDGEEDFTVTSQEETIEALQSTEDTFVLLLGAIAGISLLVGGIGIMNIMMVSVTERTREIGVRKAMGAKRRDIAMQFVAEATFLSIGGGIVGVALGLGLTVLLDGLTIGDDEFTTVFSGDIAALALVVSAAVGLFFGIFPAIRAARLHPIEALRHE